MDSNFERLVESLIKMVGRLNYKVDSLEKQLLDRTFIVHTNKKNRIHMK